MKNKNLLKINGHEGIFLNVVKSSSAGIIEATRVVSREVDNFYTNNLTNGNLKNSPS